MIIHFYVHPSMLHLNFTRYINSINYIPSTENKALQVNHKYLRHLPHVNFPWKVNHFIAVITKPIFVLWFKANSCMCLYQGSEEIFSLVYNSRQSSNVKLDLFGKGRVNGNTGSNVLWTCINQKWLWWMSSFKSRQLLLVAYKSTFFILAFQCAFRLSMKDVNYPWFVSFLTQCPPCSSYFLNVSTIIM